MREDKIRIAAFVSGGGTNLQAILDAQHAGQITDGEVVLVISNNSKAYALERAKNAGIKACVVTKKQTGSQEAFEAELIRILEEEKIVCRERYLTEDKYRQRIREATHRAFEETIISWMDINRETSLEYIILDQTPPLSGRDASGEDQKE